MNLENSVLMKKVQTVVNLLLLIGCFGLPAAAASASANPMAASIGGLGTIRGTVRDESGTAIAGATVALWRAGLTSLKQVKSGADGSFVARVLPGRYNLTAMAQGFSVASLSDVEVERSTDIAFRFNLVRTGSGQTLPERRADRNNPKYRLRSTINRRSVYQNNETAGESSAAIAQVGQNILAQEQLKAEFETVADVADSEDEQERTPAGQAVVETFFAASDDPNNAGYVGLNFATVQPVNENVQLAIAGQTGVGDNAAHRLETAARIRLNNAHRINVKVGGATIGTVQLDESETAAQRLSQMSFQVADEWRVRDGIILVLGVDYSRFFGASDASSVNPRFGLQLEANAKTRVNVAYSVANEERSWESAGEEIEGNPILFRRSIAPSVAVIEKQAAMPELRRLEFGIERVLDNSSSLEAAAFFDETKDRGLGFVGVPVSFTSTDEPSVQTATQNGGATGVRIVYSRRLNEIFDAAFGYAFGRGQSLSAEGLTTPENLLTNNFFQTASAQITADLTSGTRIQTTVRFAPRTAIFAIDPFAGRMTAHDSSLNVSVRQRLPRFGLPIRATATMDARNLLDCQNSVSNGTNALRLNSARRTLRGGIAVRF